MRQNELRIIVLLATLPAGIALLYGESGAQFASPMRVVQADPHHRDTLIAGTATAQLFRTQDGGETWTRLPFPGALRSTLHAMLIDPDTENVYIVGATSEYPEYAGVFRTSDAGATWEQTRGMQHKQVWALASWKGDPKVIAAGAQDGVFLSRDGGQTWRRLASPGSAWPQPVMSLAFDPSDSRIIYAGTPHLAWKTSDGGTTWRRLRRGMEEDSDIFSIDVDAKQRMRLLAAACSGLYSSIDGGVTWSNLERAVGGQNRTYVIARAPQHPNVILAGTSGGLFQSSDGGLTWHKLSREAARSIAFDPGGSKRVFVATDEGILRSEDGGVHFQRANPGVLASK